MELAHGLVGDAEEALGRPLLGHLVLEVPDAVAVSELVVGRPALGQNSALETCKSGKKYSLALKGMYLF